MPNGQSHFAPALILKPADDWKRREEHIDEWAGGQSDSFDMTQQTHIHTKTQEKTEIGEGNNKKKLWERGRETVKTIYLILKVNIQLSPLLNLSCCHTF